MNRLILLVLVLVVTLPAHAQTATPSPTPASCNVAYYTLQGGIWRFDINRSETPCPLPTCTLLRTHWDGQFRCTQQVYGSSSTDCGNGLPCGAIPWTLPRFGFLESPTPFPTAQVTATPTPTLTPEGSGIIVSNTPAPSATVFAPATTIADAIGTIEALAVATPFSIDGGDMSGLGGGVTDYFGYVKGIVDGISLGVLQPLFIAFISLGLIWFAIEVIRFTLPFATLVIGFVRKAVSLVLDFLPF